MKYLGINLSKYMYSSLYTENYKTDKMKLKKIQGNGKIPCVHGLEKLILLKCPLYIKSSIDFIQFLSKF